MTVKKCPYCGKWMDTSTGCLNYCCSMKMKTIELFTSDGFKIVIEYIGKLEHIAIRSIEKQKG
jgi:hypothetical protein